MEKTTSFYYKKLLFFVVILMTISSTSISFSQEVNNRKGNGIIEESDYWTTIDKYSDDFIKKYNTNLERFYNESKLNNSISLKPFDLNRTTIGACNLLSCGSFSYSEVNFNSFYGGEKVGIDGFSRYGAAVSYDDCWNDRGTVDWSEGQYISDSNENANIGTPGIIKQSNIDGGGFSLFSYKNESINQDISVETNTIYTVCFEIAVIPRYNNNSGEFEEFIPDLEFGIQSGGIVISDPLIYTNNDLNIRPATDFPNKLSTATSGNGGYQNPGGWTEIDPYWENICITFLTDNSGTANIFYATGRSGSSVVLVDGLKLSLEGYSNAPELTTNNQSLCVNDPIDLDDYVLPQTIPNGAELKWSTNSDPSVIGDHLVNTIITPPGTWYAFFYNPIYNCFSPIATLVLSSSDLGSSYTQDNLSCNDSADGAIDLTVTNGLPPYSYDWTTSDGSGLDDDVADQSGLTSGTYDVTVTDDNGCTTSETITIGQPDEVVLTATATEVTCFGDADAIITASATGGATITVDGVAYDAATTYGPGTYVVLASAAGGNTGDVCTDEITIIIGKPNDINLQTSFTNALCNGEQSGTITASADSTATITVDGLAYDGNATYTAGTYTVLATVPGGNVGDPVCSTSV
jgi:hypothetical protein